MSFLNLFMLQQINDDVSFPFSNLFPTLPLTFAERVNFEPPVTLLRRNYFTTRNKKMRGEPVGPPKPLLEPGSHEFCSTNQWKAMTTSLKFYSNFSIIIPNGHSIRTGIAPSYDDWMKHKHEQPSTHPLEYRDMEIEPVDDLLTRNPLNRTQNSDPEEPQARRFIAATRKQYLLSGRGHAEDVRSEANDACFMDFESIEPPDRDILRVFERPTCRKNKTVHTVVNNFNLNERGLDDNKAYVHVFSIETDHQEDHRLHQHLLTLCRAQGNEHITEEDIADWTIDEEQFGVVKIDGGLEMSLSRDKCDKMKTNNYAYLENSERYMKEKSQIENEGYAG